MTGQTIPIGLLEDGIADTKFVRAFAQTRLLAAAPVLGASCPPAIYWRLAACGAAVATFSGGIYTKGLRMTLAAVSLSESAVQTFQLALKRLSVTQLRKIAKNYRKDVKVCETKGQYIDALCAIMSKAQKLELLRAHLLAGRTSVSLVQFLDGPADVDVQPAFKKATHTPQIVTAGPEGEIVDGMQYIGWAVLGGSNAYIDDHLEVQTDDEAVIIHSFYDPACGILQVRANTLVANKIMKQWSKVNDVSLDRVQSIGITTREDFHSFCDLVHGGVVHCAGVKMDSGGFGKMSASIIAGLTDLRSTPDYKNWMADIDPTDEDLAFQHAGKNVHVGFNFGARSFTFRKSAEEGTLGYVYGKLKEFLEF